MRVYLLQQLMWSKLIHFCSQVLPTFILFVLFVRHEGCMLESHIIKKDSYISLNNSVKSCCIFHSYVVRCIQSQKCYKFWANYSFYQWKMFLLIICQVLFKTFLCNFLICTFNISDISLHFPKFKMKTIFRWA